MHLFQSKFYPLLKHLYTHSPNNMPRATPTQPQKSKLPASKATEQSPVPIFIDRPKLPPRKSSLGQGMPQTRSEMVQSIERSIILYDRYILLHTRKASLGPSLLDYWYLDLLHDLLICRSLVSPDTHQKILDQRDARLSDTGVSTSIQAKEALASSCYENIVLGQQEIAHTILLYEKMERQYLVRLKVETEKRLQYC